MKTAEIIAMQTRIGTVPDGFWGPKSIAACKAHLRQMMPNPKAWPRQDAASLRSFYGEAGNESNLVVITFPFPMYYEGKRCLKTRVHERCADSLLRVLADIGDRWGSRPDIMEEAGDYGGCFENRNKRGGTTKSLHAYGAAIDLDADDNSFRASWPMVADMPLQIMEAFARENWLSAGAFWGYDAMHFQATQE